MNLVTFLATVSAVVVLAGLPARADPVPDRATGIWSVAACDDGNLTVLLESNAAMMFESRGEQSRVAMARAESLAGSIILTIEGETDELVLPPLDNLTRCDAPPASFSLLFAEAITLFRHFDEIEGQCSGEDVAAVRCVSFVFNIVDVSGDGVFSQAELSRAVRAAGFFVGYGLAVEKSQYAFVPMEELSVAWLASSLLGPFFASNLIASYDFDGDGFLSLGELMQDRTPEKGIEGVSAGLATKLPPEVMSGLMKSVNGLFQLLR